MEELSIVDHIELWITYESKLHPEEHGVWDKLHGEWDEHRARNVLDFLRNHCKDRNFELQEVTVHRTAKKLNW